MAALGLHLLLVGSWRGAHPPVQETFEERIFNVIRIPPPAPEPAPARRETAVTRSRAPRTAMPALPEAATPPRDAPAPLADPPAISAPPLASETPPGAMLGRARRDAGAIDRELREGKSGVPAVADTAGGRFMRALEDAHIDTSRTVTSESYTAPDGEIVYRFRKGGKIICRIGGGVKPGIGNAIGPSAFDVQGGNGTAGLVDCPSHATWKRD